MSYRQVAKQVARKYIEDHEGADKEFVFLVCYDAAERYDTSGSRLNLEAFITLQMRMAILLAKQRAMEIQEETKEMAYTRTSDKDKEEILAELQRGDDPKEVAIRHNVKNGTLYAMMNRWREQGLLPPKEEKKTSIQDAIAACEAPKTAKPATVKEQVAEALRATPPKEEPTFIPEVPPKPAVADTPKLEMVPPKPDTPKQETVLPKPDTPKQEVAQIKPAVADIPNPVNAPFAIIPYISNIVTGAEVVSTTTSNTDEYVQATYKCKNGKKYTIIVSKEED